MTFKEKATQDLFEIKKVFNQAGVEFFLIFGTCLGAVREGGIIEHDNDIDLGVVKGRSLSEIQAGLEALDFQVSIDNPDTATPRMRANKRTLSDIHWFEPENGHYVYRNNGAVWVRIPEKFFQAFEVANIDSEEFLVPKPKEEYLEATYGDWQVVHKGKAARLNIQ